jgi:hypothetical protein
LVDRGPDGVRSLRFRGIVEAAARGIPAFRD